MQWIGIRVGGQEKRVMGSEIQGLDPVVKCIGSTGRQVSAVLDNEMLHGIKVQLRAGL